MSGPRIDIGDGHAIEFYCTDAVPTAGCFVYHPDTGAGCGGRGSVMFDKPGLEAFGSHAKWMLVDEQPLTLEPSILCTVCGDHGYIRQGRWVAA